MTTKDINLDNYFIKDNSLLKVTSLSGTKVNSTINPGDLEEIPASAEALLAIGFVYDAAWSFFRCPFAHFIAISSALDGIYLGDYIKLPMRPVNGIQSLVKSTTNQSLVVDEEALRDAALGHDLAAPVVSMVSRTSTSFEVSWPTVTHAVGYKVSIDGGATYGTAQEATTFEKTDALASTPYAIKVIAVASGTDTYRDSYPSAELVVTTLTPLASPVLTVGTVTASSFAFSWPAVTNASGYKASIDDGAAWTDQETTSFEKLDALAATQYDAKVIAVAAGGSEFENSEPSTVLEILTLSE